jgi:hypothetical protein
LSPLDEMFSANAGHETSPTKVTNNFSFTVWFFTDEQSCISIIHYLANYSLWISEATFCHKISNDTSWISLRAFISKLLPYVTFSPCINSHLHLIPNNFKCKKREKYFPDIMNMLYQLYNSVSGLCSPPGTPSNYKTQRFANWICFCLQMSGRRHIFLGPGPAKLNHWIVVSSFQATEQNMSPSFHLMREIGPITESLGFLLT